SRFSFSSPRTPARSLLAPPRRSGTRHKTQSARPIRTRLVKQYESAPTTAHFPRTIYCRFSNASKTPVILSLSDKDRRRTSTEPQRKYPDVKIGFAASNWYVA